MFHLEKNKYSKTKSSHGYNVGNEVFIGLSTLGVTMHHLEDK